MKKMFRAVDWKNGFFTNPLPIWMVAVFVAVIIAVGVIAWVVAH